VSRLTYRDQWHQYALDGKKVPSVTAITGVLDKPALANAAAKEAALWAASNTEALTILDVDDWVKAAAGAPRKVWNARAEDGRTLHTLAESIVEGHPMPTEVRGEPVADHVRDMATQLARFFDVWDVQPIEAERMVFHDNYRYAGRFDLVAELTGGTRWILDYKTGSGIYPETSLQLTAYGHATHYVNADDEDRTTSELGIERAAAVWIRPDHWELIPVAFNVRVFGVFLHAGALHSWAKLDRRESVFEPLGLPEDGVAS
jgi:hypothetical protein